MEESTRSSQPSDPAARPPSASAHGRRPEDDYAGIPSESDMRTHTNTTPCASRPSRLVPDTPTVQNFRPLILQNRMLCLCLLYHILMLVCLVVAFHMATWKARRPWSYLIHTILPYILGTLSTIWVCGVIMALSRITPFLHCTRRDGAFAVDTIFQRCFPFPSLADAVRSRSWFLVLSHAMRWLTVFIVPVKSSLFRTARPGLDVAVIPWAAQVLLTVYASFALYNIGVLYYLHTSPTGLPEGDIVTMAHHAEVFRHADFGLAFAGTGAASRASMMADSFLSRMKIKLAWWRLENGTSWYGFGLAGRDDENGGDCPTPPENGQSARFSREYLDRLTKGSVDPSLDFFSLRCQHAFWTALVLLAAHAAALAFGRTHNNEFSVPMSEIWAKVVCAYIPTTLLQVFPSFWSHARLSAGVTRPFVAMRQEGGASASESIMLDYAGLPSAQQASKALLKRHWREGLTALASLLHSLLPVLAGPRLVITPGGDHAGGSVVRLNVPLVVIVTVWLGLELVLIPLSVLTGSESRALPRHYSCVADLMSWMFNSDFLRQLELDSVASGNPDVDMHGRTPRQVADARLTLSTWSLRFGMLPAKGSVGQHTIGIGTVPAEGRTGDDMDNQMLSLWGAKRFGMVAGGGTPAGDEAGNNVDIE